MEQYPEHGKLLLVKDKSQAIGEFVEWLKDSKKISFAKWYKIDDKTNDDEEYKLLPEFFELNKILAEFFCIDLKKLEEEKRAILEEFRKANTVK